VIPVWGYATAAAAVALVVGLRILRRFRITARLHLALKSSQETIRRVAVRECVAVGVSETARMLVRHIRKEESRAVLDELVIALAERQWEPTSKAAILDLRIWARGYALDHPEVLAVEPPAAAGHGDLPAHGALPASVPSRAEQPGAAPDSGEPAPEAADLPDPAAVAPATVVVCGASGPAALATIRELSRLGHRVVAADRNRRSTGLALASVGEVLPAPDEPSFAACLVRAARAHGASAMICTAADELAALHAAQEELIAAGVRCVFPRLDAVRACADASRLREVLNEDGTAAGSREFSADVLLSVEGHVAGIVPHWQTGLVAGVPTRSETFSDDRVAEGCLQAVKSLRLTGPAAIRGSVTAEDQILLLEVRPYFSAELALSLHAGADLVGQHLRQIYGLPILAERLTALPGVVMTREIHEKFEE